MKLSKLIMGTFFTLAGAVLIILAIVVGVFIFLLIYGIPMFIIGLALLLHKGEDKIEQIKQRKKHKGGYPKQP